MKLYVIGHSVVDYINSGRSEIQQPGGIHYSALTLSLIKEHNDEIFLCTSMQKSFEHLFEETYKSLNQKYIRQVDAIPEVKLDIFEKSERGEHYKNITKKLEIPFGNLYKFDGILINMITGFDIDLQQMIEIRKNYNGLIYFDVHTFSRGLNPDGKREFRKIPEFEKWASLLDLIQVNEIELKTISKYENEFDIAKHILDLGVKYLIITKEKKGARVYFKRKNEIISIFHSALKVKSKNKVGCGDVFGASFFYNYLKTNKINKALELANITAGITASYSNLNDFRNLKNDIIRKLG